MKLNLSFRKIHSLFLSTGILSKGKTVSGTAFEAIIHKIVSDDFYIWALGKMTSEKINFGPVPVKRLIDKPLEFISLIFSYNRTFEKLLTSILATIDYPVYHLKKRLKTCDELLFLNQSEADCAGAGRLKKWKNENNLKKIITKLKTNERKTL